jgi:hypothetical protein
MAAGGIGHVGVVIDDTPTTQRHGVLGDGTGNASVTISNAYGNVALALSTRAANVLAALPSAVDDVSSRARVCASAAPMRPTRGAADEARGANVALPAALEFLRPMVGTLNAVAAQAVVHAGR